jgi:hypothetical protein
MKTDMKVVLAGGVAMLLIAIFVMGIGLANTGALGKMYERTSGIQSALVKDQPNLKTSFEVRGSFSDDMKAYSADPSEYISFGPDGTMRVGPRGADGVVQYIKEYRCGGYCAKETGQIAKCAITQAGDIITCGCEAGYKHSGCKWIAVAGQ